VGRGRGGAAGRAPLGADEPKPGAGGGVEAPGLEPRAGRRRGGGTTGREAAGVEAQTGVRIDGPKGGELGLFQNSKTN